MAWRFYTPAAGAGIAVAVAMLAGCASASPPAPSATAVPTPVPAPTVTSAPPPAAAPTAAPAPATSAPPAAEIRADFTPKVRTVWNTAIGSNTMVGACNGNPILPAYGQVQITPQGDSLEWKNQQATYVFRRTSPGEWRFAGPSPLNDGTVDLVVTFKDAKSLGVVHKLVPLKDPGCTHVFSYNGTFMWERP